jgi:DNA repair protein RadA/Sms
MKSKNSILALISYNYFKRYQNMNSKKQTTYLCHACGATANKWSGKCQTCNEWGSLEEIAYNESSGQSGNSLVNFNKILQTDSLNGEYEQHSRIKTGINEFDNMIGGGMVNGSVILVGGEPGIGKSTLLLQITSHLAKRGLNCLYISGEESSSQIKIRANRLKIDDQKIKVLTTNSLESICSTTLSLKNIDFMIVDSIQTIHSDKIGSSMGSIAQVKLCTHELVEMAKNNSIITVIVGQITKDGSIAGPKFLEHMVDTVLYFEGDQSYRILRSVKNRYGATNEIAVFEMRELGLYEVTNPSMFFLNSQGNNVTGSVTFSGMEGTRPLMAEIQCLIAQSYMPVPKRAVVGLDYNRLSMIVAVLSARYNMNVADKEIYLNVVGGLKIQDPSADLAIAVALISFFCNKPIPKNTVVCGEVGLAGEIRPVPYIESRLKEALKLGFENAIIPNQEVNEKNLDGLKMKKVKYLKELIDWMK